MFNMSQWSSTCPRKYTGATLEGFGRCWRVSADARGTNSATGVAGHPPAFGPLADQGRVRPGSGPERNDAGWLVGWLVGYACIVGA